MSIPDLQDNGELPPGIHETTLAELYERFGYNMQRLKLIRGLEAAIANLSAAGVVDVYIDGSFTTSKSHPKDIDGCWDAHSSIDINILDPVFLDFSFSRRAMKYKYGVDFFISQTIEAHSGFPFVEFFQLNRNDEPKGILRIHL